MLHPGPRRDPLVRQYFIAFDSRGQPRRAGQIKSSIAPGRYIAAFTFDDPLGPHGECITAEQVSLDHWNLYLTESAWRAAFAQAARQEVRPTDGEDTAAMTVEGAVHEQLSSPRTATDTP